MASVSIAFRFVLASVFLTAGASKLPRRSEFEKTVQSYDLLPEQWATRVAIWLPRLELVLGVLLGLGLFVTPAAAVAGALLLVFSIAVVVNLVRRREIDCGCFGFLAPRQNNWATATRNIGLAAMAAAEVAAGAGGSLSLDAAVLGHEGGASVSQSLAMVIVATLSLAAVALISGSIRLRRLSVMRGTSR